MDEIKLYENKQIRSAWDDEKEEWYFSVVDVVGVLTEQENARGSSNYWAVLKKRLKEEGNEGAVKQVPKRNRTIRSCERSYFCGKINLQ